jgi:chloramphenicol 3-O-phosphotransferase
LRLIFIYGPPASGKLTIARELAKLTGYKVFHNHLTVDLANEIFPFGTRPWADIVFRTRELVVATAARERLPGLIFTFVYAHPHDERYVRRVARAATRNGGRAHFVQIDCPDRVLLRRVKAKGRREFGKLKSASGLARLLRRWDLHSPVRLGPSLRIDTSRTRPRRAASAIRDHFSL